MSSERHIVVLLRRLLCRPGMVHGNHILGTCEQAALGAARALAGTDGTITAVTVGRARREEKTLEMALRAGASRAIRVSDSGADKLDFLGTAQVLASVIAREERVDAVLCGDRSADVGAGAVGPAVAELLELPHLCGVIDLQAGDDIVATTRALGHIQRYRVEWPAVLCIRDFPGQLELAAKSPTTIERLSFRELDLQTRELTARIHLSGNSSPVRPGNNATVVPSAAALVGRLDEDYLLG